MADQKLDNYIKKQISAGYSLGQIKHHLLQSGWSEDEINKAIATITQPKITPKKSRIFWILWILSLFIILIGVGIFTIFTFREKEMPEQPVERERPTEEPTKVIPTPPSRPSSEAEPAQITQQQPETKMPPVTILPAQAPDAKSAIPLPANSKCFWDTQEHTNLPECARFYREEPRIGKQLACPKYYNPVCGADGLFYPSACWAEQLGTTVAGYGYCPSLIAFFRKLWRERGFDVPSPNIEFSYSGSGIVGWKSGVWLRSTLWTSSTEYSVLDYNIKVDRVYDTRFGTEMSADFLDVTTLISSINTQPRALLAFVMFDEAYPEDILLDWTSRYKDLFNDYIAKKFRVPNAIQYEFIPIVLDPPEGVEKLSSTHIFYSDEEIQKVYDATVQKAGQQNFEILIISPVVIKGFGGYYRWWNDFETVIAPLSPPASYSATDKQAGLNALAAFQNMFLTISHEVLHAVGLLGDHIPMGYGTYWLDWIRNNINFETGKLLPGEIDFCEFFPTSPDYYAVELPSELKIKVGEEPSWLVKTQSQTGDCLQGLHSNEILKDADKDGEYEIMYKHNLIGIELQRTLGWVDIDGDGVIELVDPTPYGGYKKI